MPSFRFLSEVPPIYGDSYETSGYQRCDCCFETACEDIWAGRLVEDQWRRFYELLGEGVVVCENCLPDLWPIEVDLDLASAP